MRQQSNEIAKPMFHSENNFKTKWQAMNRRRQKPFLAVVRSHTTLRVPAIGRRPSESNSESITPLRSTSIRVGSLSGGTGVSQG